ncbi:hypothetical protein AGMMS49579_15020 [Spirochaetia bacterium]|nr:hypothetical protein AGMMS49579_15020 [Spirochaetia bacterium]
MKRRRIISLSILVLLVLSVVGLRFRVAQLHKISGYEDKGYVYYGEEDYDNAIIAYNEAIRLLQIFDRNNSGRVYNLRGNVYSAKGDYVQAIADYTQAIKLKPDVSYYLNRGLSYRTTDWDSAIADFTSAIQIAPEERPLYKAEIYAWRAIIYGYKDEYDKAIADCNAALQSVPEGSPLFKANLYTWRALQYKDKGEYDKAIADYNAALQINPDDTEAKSGLSYVNNLKNPKEKISPTGKSDIKDIWEEIEEFMSPPQ